MLYLAQTAGFIGDIYMSLKYSRVPILGAPLTFSFSSPFLRLKSGCAYYWVVKTVMKI